MTILAAISCSRDSGNAVEFCEDARAALVQVQRYERSISDFTLSSDQRTRIGSAAQQSAFELENHAPGGIREQFDALRHLPGDAESRLAAERQFDASVTDMCDIDLPAARFILPFP